MVRKYPPPPRGDILIPKNYEFSIMNCDYPADTPKQTMLYRELNTVGGYLPHACGGGKITSPQFFLIDKGILQWCAKGIVIL